MLAKSQPVLLRRQYRQSAEKKAANAVRKNMVSVNQ